MIVGSVTDRKEQFKNHPEKEVHSMAIDIIGGHNFSLRKQETSTSAKRKVGMTATTLFPEDEVKETEESQARYQEYERIRNKMLTGEKL